VNGSGIGPDPDKVKAMLEFPVPTSQKKLKGALSMFQFYRKYIQEYSRVVAPMKQLLLKKDTFHWTEVEQEVFEILKERLKNTPFMQYPNDDGVFTLETNVFGLGINPVSIKTQGGRWHSGMWRQESPWAEFNYTVTELEMLSVVEALNKYRHFLIGRYFVIKYDQFSLRFIFSLKDSSMGRLFWWYLQRHSSISN